MHKFLALLLALPILACDATVPDKGCVVVMKDGSQVHVEYCDAGQAGTGGASGMDSGGGAGGAVGGAGSAGHDHGGAGASGMPVAGMPVAGASGVGAAGSDAGHMHGGLPVTLPLPAVRNGRTDMCFVTASSNPMRDEGGIGAARTRCYVSHENFDDAIVYPGMPGLAHLHQYAGADKSDAFGVPAGAGGTCRGGAVNLSSYWWPALLRPDGTVIRPAYSDHYYKQSNYDLSGTPEVFPPPKGLKIVAGDMRATQAAPQSQNRFYWTCNEDGSRHFAGLPTGQCSSVTLNVHFPPCWDGVNLDSADHKSHMAYPAGGRCPATHPRLLPSISYHVLFRNVPQGSKLSCDSATMAGGYCTHADIVVGWDEQVMATMVARCVNTGLSCGSDLVGDGRSMCIFGGN